MTARTVSEEYAAREAREPNVIKYMTVELLEALLHKAHAEGMVVGFQRAQEIALGSIKELGNAKQDVSR